MADDAEEVYGFDAAAARDIGRVVRWGRREIAAETSGQQRTEYPRTLARVQLTSALSAGGSCTAKRLKKENGNWSDAGLPEITVHAVLPAMSGPVNAIGAAELDGVSRPPVWLLIQLQCPPPAAP